MFGDESPTNSRRRFFYSDGFLLVTNEFAATMFSRRRFCDQGVESISLQRRIRGDDVSIRRRLYEPEFTGDDFVMVTNVSTATIFMMVTTDERDDVFTATIL